MRRLLILLATTALLTATGLLGAGLASAQSTHEVDVADNAFVPDTITITAGDTVRWTHSGANPHTITAADGSFDSHPDCPPDFEQCMSTGDTFEQTFTEAAEITYYCKIHGTADGSGMAGTIVIQAADTTGDAGDGADSTQDDDTAEEPAVTGSLSASDQASDGATIAIEEATISGAPGFVVIHADGGGSPGAVIGHGAIDEGTTADFTVTLDEPLGEDATVWPMLHQDAGTVGTYEFPGADGPVSDADGVITFPISVTVDAAAEPALPRTGAPLVVLGALAVAGIAVGAIVKPPR